MPTVQSCSRMRGSITADADEVNMGTYSIRYLVITDGEMGPQSVANGALSASPHALPAMWSKWNYGGDTDNYSFARKYKVECDPDSVLKYYVTVTWAPLDPGDGSQSVGGNPINSVTNPVNRSAVMWWDREVYTMAALRDKDGKAIVNKCQDYYPEDIELEYTRGVLVVEKNYSTLGQVIALSQQYDGAVNSSSWTIQGGPPNGSIIQPRCALCREISSGAPQTEQGYTFFHVVFRFALRAGTWDEPKIECGQFHWSKTGSEYDEFAGHRKVTDAKKIVPLNTDGTRLADGADFITTSWRIRREVDFNTLGF